MFCAQLKTNIEKSVKKLNEAYDVIIIGGGVCGAVIARELLKKDLHCSILLIEAGSYHAVEYGNLIQNMQAYGSSNDYQLPFTDHLVQEDLKSIYHGGNGLGGSSISNGAVLVTSTKKDFYQWKKKFGLEHWTNQLEEVVEEYEKLLTPDGHEAKEEPLFQKAKQLINEKFFPEKNPDHGAKYTKVIHDNEQRRDVFAALLKEFYGDDRLSIITSAQVLKISFEKTQAGAFQAKKIHLKMNNSMYEINVSNQLILTAGTIFSPLVLQNSGIGPREILKNAEIEQILDLPVGMNLSVHYSAFSSGDLAQETSVHVNMPLSIFSCGSSDFNPKESTSDKHQSRYKSQFFIGRNKESKKAERITVGTFAFENHSLGTVCLKQKDKFETVEIETSSNRDEKDKENLQEALQISNHILRELQAIGCINNIEEKPLKESFYVEPHFIGTCRVFDVTQPNFKLNGVDNLYIGDASVLPEQPSGNTMFPSIIVAALCSQTILNELTNSEQEGMNYIPGAKANQSFLIT